MLSLVVREAPDHLEPVVLPETVELAAVGDALVLPALVETTPIHPLQRDPQILPVAVELAPIRPLQRDPQVLARVV
jgi:hypothetical protein